MSSSYKPSSVIDLPILQNGKKLYFASDFHLGAPNLDKSKSREKRIVKWLDHIKDSAGAVFLVGDIFDFWFEYKHVIPKGHTRLLGKLAEFVDANIPVHLFCGNHDMWMFGYLQNEIGVQVHRDEFEFTQNGFRFFVAHGDGLGPGDYKYKRLKKIFRHPLCQWLFARIHPNIGIGIAQWSSHSSRKANADEDKLYKGTDHEYLYHYVHRKSQTIPADIFVFGHRHLPLRFPIRNSLYYNLGEWINYETFLCFDGQKASLLTFKNDTLQPYLTIPERT